VVKARDYSGAASSLTTLHALSIFKFLQPPLTEHTGLCVWPDTYTGLNSLPFRCCVLRPNAEFLS